MPRRKGDGSPRTFPDQNYALYEVDRPEAHKRAKNAYMTRYASATEIELNYGIPSTTVNNWIFQGRPKWKEKPWNKERQKLEAKHFSKIFRGRVKSLEDLVDFGIENLKRSMAAYFAEQTKLTPTDMQKVSSVLLDVHKVCQLEQDKPTDIHESRSYSERAKKSVIDDLREMGFLTGDIIDDESPIKH